MINTEPITLPKKEKKENKRKMIPIEKAATIFWGKSQGEQLTKKRIEKKISMNKMSAKLKEYGVSCVPSNLVKLEKGEAKTIKTETLFVLISLLDLDVKDFLN